MPEAESERPTLHDVARLAGVSCQMVSRVIEGRPDVAQETQERVRDAMACLDFEPDTATEGRAGERTRILQLLTFDLNYNDPLPSMCHWAKEAGYALAISEYDCAHSPEKLLSTVEMFAARMVDGIVMFTPYQNLDAEQLRRSSLGIPLIVAGTAQERGLPSVVFSQQRGAELALEHLLGLGHRQIAEVSGPLDPEGEGLKRAHHHAEIRHRVFLEKVTSPALSVEGDFTIRGGYEATQQLLAREQPFTAIFYGNDRMALGGLRALREHGLRIPEDVSVVGFDDMFETAFFEPPLTTVRQDLDTLARESIAYLIALIEHPETPITERVLEPELVVRQSTRALD